jgi:hypothetical protein
MKSAAFFAGVLLALAVVVPPSPQAQTSTTQTSTTQTSTTQSSTTQSSTTQTSANCVAPQRQPTFRPDLSDKWFGCDGQLRWPPNDGFHGTPATQILNPGDKIDRYGSDYGTFFGKTGASCGSRALPYDCAKLVYNRYVVVKPLSVQAGPAESWFDEPGGSVQYKTAVSVLQLKQDGVIVIAPK